MKSLGDKVWFRFLLCFLLDKNDKCGDSGSRAYCSTCVWCSAVRDADSNFRTGSPGKEKGIFLTVWSFNSGCKYIFSVLLQQISQKLRWLLMESTMSSTLVLWSRRFTIRKVEWTVWWAYIIIMFRNGFVGFLKMLVFSNFSFKSTIECWKFSDSYTVIKVFSTNSTGFQLLICCFWFNCKKKCWKLKDADSRTWKNMRIWGAWEERTEPNKRN